MLLLTLFALQVAVAVVAFTFQGKTEDVLTQSIEKIYQNYVSNANDKNIVDSLQKQVSTFLHLCVIKIVEKLPKCITVLVKEKWVEVINRHQRQLHGVQRV